MSMSISERVEFEALKRRIADLEARVSANVARPPDGLRRRNESRQAAARRLDDAIASALADHSQVDRLTAKHILRMLERADFGRLPSERTVRLHLAAVRGNGNARVVPLHR